MWHPQQGWTSRHDEFSGYSCSCLGCCFLCMSCFPLLPVRRRFKMRIFPFEVVWYSWSSNWGADFYGGVRISLPDPASSSVVQGYTAYPNGSLAVDYPDVVLLKLLARTLFPRAPEAYWLLNNFKISPSELYELLGQTGTRSVQERMDAACQWLKSKRERFLTSLSRLDRS